VTLRFGWVTIDCDDVDRLADFWKAALGFQEIYRSDPGESPREVMISIDPEGKGWTILLYEVHDPRTVKNRLHFDLRPEGDQAEEVARLEGLGAKRIDIGQGEQNWVVMADPEGNEFCVLRPRSESP
jgi:catechol 2,3-dioxygenase-like lactoylglutathione lyase family enzyme